MSNLRHEFLLEPDVVYLNHGSFGATPRPVFQVYQAWQLRMERQPVRFITEELFPALKQARDVLGAYLGAPGDDLVYIPNATFGANLAARSLALQPGDEILTTDHEYGACNNVWQYVAEKTGAAYIHQPIALPVTTAEELVEQLWAGVNERTRVIYLSHITSPTALIMPVAAICHRARDAGIITVIDGAHAPGQIDLNLETMGPDFYFGNCHKWLMSPKGAGFLYARPERQPTIEPLVVGWAGGDNGTSPSAPTSWTTPNIWAPTTCPPTWLCPRPWSSRRPTTGRPSGRAATPWPGKLCCGSPI